MLVSFTRPHLRNRGGRGNSVSAFAMAILCCSFREHYTRFVGKPSNAVAGKLKILLMSANRGSRLSFPALVVIMVGRGKNQDVEE